MHSFNYYFYIIKTLILLLLILLLFIDYLLLIVYCRNINCFFKAVIEALVLHNRFVSGNTQQLLFIVKRTFC